MCDHASSGTWVESLSDCSGGKSNDSYVECIGSTKHLLEYFFQLSILFNQLEKLARVVSPVHLRYFPY